MLSTQNFGLSIAQRFTLSKKLAEGNTTIDQIEAMEALIDDNLEPRMVRDATIYNLNGMKHGTELPNEAFVQLISALNERRLCSDDAKEQAGNCLIVPRSSFATLKVEGCDAGPVIDEDDFTTFNAVEVMSVPHAGVYASSGDTFIYWEWMPSFHVLTVVGRLSPRFAAEIPLIAAAQFEIATATA